MVNFATQFIFFITENKEWGLKGRTENTVVELRGELLPLFSVLKRLWRQDIARPAIMQQQMIKINRGVLVCLGVVASQILIYFGGYDDLYVDPKVDFM